MIGAVANCIQILEHKNMPLRRQVMLNYLWLKVKGLPIVKVFRTQRTRDRILGFWVTYFDFDVFAYLFKEIVVTWLYHFSSASKKPLIIDCGSNIGMSILFFKKLYPAATVIGFEPDPATFALLTRNVKDNNLTDVTLYNKAITDAEGEVEFFVDTLTPGSLAMSLISQPGLDQSIQVPSVTLSSVFGDKSVDFVKMDIEGAETRVLRQLSQSGALGKIQEMVIEYHHHFEGPVDGLSEALSILERNKFGYQVTSPDQNFHTNGAAQAVWIHAYNKRSRSSKEVADRRQIEQYAPTV